MLKLFERARDHVIGLALPNVEEGGLETADLHRYVERADAVILDIGCNDGAQTAWFRRSFPQGRVFGFEPDPRAAAAFERRLGDDPGVTLNRFAMSGSDGVVTFHTSDGVPPDRDPERYPDGWHASGSIRKPKRHLDKHPWCTFDESIVVPCRSLDSWADEQGLDRIDFIWADVQGAEVDLIEGGRQTLARTRYFYTEYNNQELYEGQISLVKMLALLPGFEIQRRFRNDVLLRNTAF